MKTLILYESKKGFTKKCGKFLYGKIDNCDIFPIESKDFDMNNYDRVLIGAPIYSGELEEYTQKFIKKHKFLLLEKELGLFCSGMNRVEFHTAIQDSLPPNIFYHAKIVHCGGVIDYSLLTLKEKYTIWRRLRIKGTIKDEMLDSLDELINKK